MKNFRENTPLLMAAITAGVLTICFLFGLIYSQSEIERLKQFEEKYDERQQVKETNPCVSVYGKNCVFFLFDDYQNCMGVTDSNLTHLRITCRRNEDGETILEITSGNRVGSAPVPNRPAPKKRVHLDLAA